MRPSVLVAGIGNVFLGDDGFGVEVVNALRERALPEHVDLVDFGLRGMELASALGSGYRMAIMIDSAVQGRPPGTIGLRTPDDTIPAVNSRRLDPINVLRQAKRCGAVPRRVLLVEAEPGRRRGAEPVSSVDLSPPVRAAVPEAVSLVLDLLSSPEAWDDHELHRPRRRRVSGQV